MSEMTMVERVALAISGSDDPANILAIHRARARLAIAAMREPTPQMETAAEASNFEGWSPEPGEGRDYLDLSEAWRAMIDAALRESPGEPQAHQRARKEDTP